MIADAASSASLASTVPPAAGRRGRLDCSLLRIAHAGISAGGGGGPYPAGRARRPAASGDRRTASDLDASFLWRAALGARAVEGYTCIAHDPPLFARL